jgi:hypothetical protein
MQKPVIETAKRFVSKRLGVAMEHLTYIGDTDCPHSKIWVKLIMFQVTDPKHVKFNSSVTYEVFR